MPPLPNGHAQNNQQRLRIDWTRCQGRGLCAQRIPELIQPDAQGYPVIFNSPVPSRLEREAHRAGKNARHGPCGSARHAILTRHGMGGDNSR